MTGTHRRDDDVGRVVVDSAVDRHGVAVEGLPDEAVRRHLERRGALVREEPNVQPLRHAAHAQTEHASQIYTWTENWAAANLTVAALRR